MLLLIKQYLHGFIITCRNFIKVARTEIRVINIKDKGEGEVETMKFFVAN